MRGQHHKSSGKGRKKKRHSAEAEGVRAKKHLGQHFLKDEQIAQKIADTLSLESCKNVLEIGPGTGVLTKFLLLRDIRLAVMEIDTESVAFLHAEFPKLHPELAPHLRKLKILESDFLKADLDTLFQGQSFAITGNFPYNISTQIVFKVLENRHRIPEFSGMFQKEVAERIVARPGSVQLTRCRR